MKWAGGKRQLLPRIRQFYPETFGTYVEPFVGSGAVFFDLASSGLLTNRRTVLIDSNVDLVGCYLALRDHPGTVIRALARLATAYSKNPGEHYYTVRDRRFNPARRRIRDRNGDPVYPPSLAAILIYLNRTGFNGLFRLNAAGMFNVPIGRYTNPRICDPDNLRNAAAVLGRGVTILHGNFETVLEHAVAGDFVYLDPPYAPLSRTACFTSYTRDGFSVEDQERLQRVVVQLARRGCRVLLSNSTAPEVARLYDGNARARAAGLRAHTVPARRAINSNAARRGEILEYLITNVPPRAN